MSNKPATKKILLIKITSVCSIENNCTDYLLFRNPIVKRCNCCNYIYTEICKIPKDVSSESKLESLFKITFSNFLQSRKSFTCMTCHFKVSYRGACVQEDKTGKKWSSLG